MDTTSNDATIQNRKILFVTNAESGQANTTLAMALEAITRPHVEVHVASFPALKRRVERLSPELNFHPLDGEAMFKMMAGRGLPEEKMPHPPTTKSYEPYGRMAIGVTMWNGECASRLLPPSWDAGGN
jgi:hypothetical protein